MSSLSVSDFITIPAEILFCVARPLPCLNMFGLTLLLQKNLDGHPLEKDHSQQALVEWLPTLAFDTYKSIVKPILGLTTLYSVHNMANIHTVIEELANPDYNAITLLFPLEAGHSLAKKVLKLADLIFNPSLTQK